MSWYSLFTFTYVFALRIEYNLLLPVLKMPDLKLKFWNDDKIDHFEIAIFYDIISRLNINLLLNSLYLVEIFFSSFNTSYIGRKRFGMLIAYAIALIWKFKSWYHFCSHYVHDILGWKSLPNFQMPTSYHFELGINFDDISHNISKG